VIDPLTSEKGFEDFKCLVGSLASSGRIDTHDLHFVSVLSTHPDTKRKAPWGLFSECRELTRYDYWMTES
jgi:hypothetical protein